jgi:peptide/nickel transport system substrate-binding protein
MMMALDRQQIIDDIWSGAAKVAHSYLSPKFAFYYNPDLKQYPYDPDAANTLLDEAGWVDADGDGIRDKDGVALSFTVHVITGDQARRPIAEVAQQYLAKVGIEMEIVESPVASIMQGLLECTIDAGLWNSKFGSLDPDPYSGLHSEGGFNFSCYSNPKMDELIEQGIQIADPDARQPLYYESQEIFVEDVPVLYIMVDDTFKIFSTDIKGLPEEALFGAEIYATAWQWWLEE